MHQRAEDRRKMSFSPFTPQGSLFFLQLRELNITYFFYQSFDIYHFFLGGKELFATFHDIHHNRGADKVCSKHNHYC